MIAKWSMHRDTHLANEATFAIDRDSAGFLGDYLDPSGFIVDTPAQGHS
jgi:hypothetical protein